MLHVYKMFHFYLVNCILEIIFNVDVKKFRFFSTFSYLIYYVIKLCKLFVLLLHNKTIDSEAKLFKLFS